MRLRGNCIAITDTIRSSERLMDAVRLVHNQITRSFRCFFDDAYYPMWF